MLFLPLLLLGAAAHPGLIVPESVMTGAGVMTRAEVQRFLDRQGAGIARTNAADIIVRAAASERISPSLLLVLLQREQSLVTDPTPTIRQMDWAMGYGVCDACRTDDPRLEKFRGFETQVRLAAKRIRELHGLPQKGTRVIDGTPIVIQNKITDVLYTYTPHLQGNANAAKIWKKWFARPRYIPNYSVVRDPSSALYLFVDDTLRPLSAKSFKSNGYHPEEVIDVSHDDISNYPRL